MMDVPLEFADFYWRPGADGAAVVVHHFEAVDKPPPHPKVAGCVEWGWTTLGSHDQLLLIMSAAWSAAVRDDVPIGILHRALITIPEYRGLFAHHAEPAEPWDER